jgi:hypothetical protein
MGGGFDVEEVKREPRSKESVHVAEPSLACAFSPATGLLLVLSILRGGWLHFCFISTCSLSNLRDCPFIYLLTKSVIVNLILRK